MLVMQEQLDALKNEKHTMQVETLKSILARWANIMRF